MVKKKLAKKSILKERALETARQIDDLDGICFVSSDEASVARFVFMILDEMYDRILKMPKASRIRITTTMRKVADEIDLGGRRR